MEPVRVNIIVDDTDNATFDHVQAIFEMFFEKTEEESLAAAHEINNNGSVIAGSYIREIAETKVYEIYKTCQLNNFELPCYIEGEKDKPIKDEGLIAFELDEGDDPYQAAQQMIETLGIESEEEKKQLIEMLKGIVGDSEKASKPQVVDSAPMMTEDDFIKAMEEQQNPGILLGGGMLTDPAGMMSQDEYDMLNRAMNGELTDEDLKKLNGDDE